MTGRTGVQIPTDAENATLSGAAESREMTKAPPDSAVAPNGQAAEGSQGAIADAYSLGSNDGLTVGSSAHQAREVQVLYKLVRLVIQFVMHARALHSNRTG